MQNLIKNKPGFAAKYKEMKDFIYNPNPQKNVYSRQSSLTNTIITIPVVFHVLYKNTNQNISEAQIQSQLDVINKDFRKLNTDFSTVVPTVFKPFAADIEINFCKATIDPNGAVTTGITRKLVPDTFVFEEEYSTSSGQTPWDTSKYLNVWVGSFTDIDKLGLLGFAIPPTIPVQDNDGIIISYKAFGTSGTAVTPHRKGRTVTHEIGHYLGLLHPWADGNDSCGFGDGIADTPETFDSYGDCPTFPSNQYACVTTTNGSMFMNYMDYVDDACMAFFTLGQKEVMRNILAGPRLSLLTSNGCGNLGLNDFEAINAIALYPNPVSQYFMITSPQIQIDKVEIYTVLGQLVKTQKLIQTNNEINIEEFPRGTYYLRIYNQGKFLKSDKIIKK
ncbi:M43 family zinc metalloprotease [Flavobacterium luteum]|uniref:M43 family zinc metalloprotease n=1 Tax=Flavobacterium luteum TaxID=2026654 RepID=UPI00178437EE|nr:M43 family zinc metalloprotease [Flavobacterium luteum]